MYIFFQVTSQRFSKFQKKKHKQTKQNRKKKIRKKKQLRKGIITNHFNWCQPFREETVLGEVKKKILYYPYYSREMEGEGPLFASLTEGTDAFLKERTQD